ncbi:hypothetical protein [Alteromonas sp. H39]|uniref:hypothetical protein n=1 Tax=Alteromonas sp. H39 TaxID=3389876 RepID=UPI0039E07485
MQDADATPVTAPTRHFLLEALLVFATAGLYLGVWFYLAARDFRRIAGQPSTPVLWIFVPFFALLQPFALPRFFNALRDAQKRLDCPRWPAIFDYLWMAAFFGLTVASNLATVVKLDVLTQLGLFFVLVVWFIPLHVRVNRLRRRVSHKPVMPRSAGYNVPEWIAVLLFTPVLVTVFTLLLHEEIKLAMTEEYAPHTSVKKDGLPFYLPLSQTGWKKVDTGTVTDGTSAFELVGPLSDMWYAVFIYNDEESMQNLSNNRYDGFVSSLSSPECDFTRTFIDNTTRVWTWTICESVANDKRVIYLASQKEGDNNQIIELVGFFEASAGIMEKYKDDFINDAKGFGFDK